MNLVVQSGRLIKTPEVESINGIVRTTFKLAVRRRFKNKKTGEYESDFPFFIAWRRTAEYITKNLKKGDYIEVVASYRTEQYTKDGETKSFNYFLVEDVRFISHPKEKEISPESEVEDSQIPAPEDIEIPQALLYNFGDDFEELEEL